MTSLGPDSPSVLAHLTMAQGVIGRLAANSASCKTWCVTLLAALLVVGADKKISDPFTLSILPLAMFCLLDAYYLALERTFRSAYNGFVRRLHSGEATQEDLFALSPSTAPIGVWDQLVFCLFSPSVLPVYGIIALLLWVVTRRLGV